MVMGFLVDWCAKNGGLNGMEGQTLLACGSKVIVWFSQPDGQENIWSFWKTNEGGIRLKLMA